MSSRPTEITSDIYNYLLNNFSAEDKLLAELKKDASKQGIPEICISAEQGRFLQFYLKSINAKYVLEIGSLAGYSAIVMARALPKDGKLIAVEINPKNAEFIKLQAEKAGLSDVIEVINADAQCFVKEFKPGFELDFVFIDADKRAYHKYFDYTSPLLRKGGVICADNALAFGMIAQEDPESEPKNVNALKRYNEKVVKDSNFFTTLVTMGDGMAMSIKL